jgi:hypothetical protein
MIQIAYKAQPIACLSRTQPLILSSFPTRNIGTRRATEFTDGNPKISSHSPGSSIPWIKYNADKQQATCTYRRCKMYVTFLSQLSVVRGHILIWRRGCLFSMREAQSTEVNAHESSSKSRNRCNLQLLNSITTPSGLAYTALGG